MSKKWILIVEDEKNISKLVSYNLDQAGFECVVARSGEEALECLNKQNFDLIVLDVMLPKIDGFEVCRRLKQDSKFKQIPVIMLTARGEEVDRIVGLELGADDYMVKPFSPRELVLRVKAIIRRGKSDEMKEQSIAQAGITVDIPKHRVLVGSKEIEMTPMEFKLLTTLMQRAGLVQTREALLADVWDIHADVSTRTVDTHIKRLREKLGKCGSAIETVVGLGYRFKDAHES